MTTYLSDLADALVPDVTLGPTDAGICAAALLALDALMSGVRSPILRLTGPYPANFKESQMSDIKLYTEQFSALAIAAKAIEIAGEDDSAMRASMREVIGGAMNALSSPVNVSDRWSLLVGAVMVFGAADPDVARLAFAFGVEADAAACALVSAS